ncbi:MAG: FHA domain-containing protein [Lentisphaeria bacterium]
MLFLTLEHNGQLVAELSADQIETEISIGRDPSCQLRASVEDKLISSRHAVVKKRGKNFLIQDADSRNGIFLRGKRISGCKLRPGLKLTIGESILVVEEVKNAERGASVHKLVALNGPLKGKKIPLQAETMLIGSDPEAQIPLLDLLVSKKHADLLLKVDGSCWIKDLESRNGTFVNGVKLTSGAERLLKNNDRLGIAQFELRFEDGAFEHRDSRLWLRLFIALLTVGLGLLAYQGYMAIKPSAEVFLNNARQLAFEENFDGARLLAKDVFVAKGAEKNAPAATELLRQIDVWEKTLTTWRQAGAALEAKSWTSAARLLAALQVGGAESWAWNDEAGLLRQQANTMKNSLDNMLRAKTMLLRDDCDLVELQEIGAKMNRLTGFPAGKAYGAVLKKEMELSVNRINELMTQNQKLSELLQDINHEKSSFEKLAVTIAALQKDGAPQLRRRADMVIEPLKGLHRAQVILQEGRRLIADAEFEAAAKMELVLPSLESCSIDANISNCRKALDAQGEKVRNMLNQARYLYSQYIALGENNSVELEGLNALQDKAQMAKVFACDILDGPLPKHFRAVPASVYDRILGFEEFYLFLNALPEKTSSQAMADLPFISLLSLTVQRLAYGSRLRHFIEEADFSHWLQNGKLAATAEKIKKNELKRDEIIQQLLQQAENGQGREAIIAAAIAEKLCPENHQLTLKGQELVPWLVAQLKDLRRQINELLSEFDRSGPSVQIQLRDQIIGLGIPGDFSLRRMWALREAAK